MVTAAQPDYSIIVPAFNESQRIRACLENILATLDAEEWNAEILVVNDGSRDDTAAIVQQFASVDPRVRLVSYPQNRGKGYAVRQGFRESLGRVVMFTDADLSAPIVEAERLFAAIRGGADIAIGSRWLGRHIFDRHIFDRSRQAHSQPLHRQLLGRCFNLITRVGIGLKFHDTQCGFKAFTREAAQTIFQLQTIQGWGFDPEILFIAEKRHFRMEEVAVTWEHDERSHLSYLRDGIQILREMAVVRKNASLGRYNVPVQPIRRQVG